MPELNAFYQPQSLREALDLLALHGEQARPLAGGTSLVFSGSSRTGALVDLSRAGLDTVSRQPDGLHVGAMVPFSRLWAFLGDDEPRALGEAARVAGSRILQNHITVGGNCVQVYAWSDLPVALTALHASFRLQGSPQGDRSFDAEQWFDGHPARKLARGELLVEIVVPPLPPGSASAHVKFTRTVTDHGIAAIAAVLTVENGHISGARIVAGAVRPMPQLLPEAAEFLVGEAPTGDVLAEAARLAAQEVRVAADFRTTMDYRKQLVAALTSDALSAAARRAGGEA